MASKKGTKSVVSDIRKSFDMSSMVKQAQEKSKSDAMIGTGLDIGTLSQNPEDYVVLPDWWKETFGIPGLEFGRIVQVAGTSDSGKTSLAMLAIKAAQDQGFGVAYTETEGKTPDAYFKNWNIDSSAVGLTQSKFVEEAFDGSFAWIDTFFENFPKEKLLFVFDSYGNTVSINDANNSMTKEARVGGTAKVNRRALNILLSKMHKFPIAVLIVNYTYDNIGSPGKTNAGGHALNFFSTISIQTTRKGWIEGDVNKKKVRKGAKVKWNVFKNHYAQALVDEDGTQINLPKDVELSITAEGFKKL